MSTVIIRPDQTWTATAGTKVGGATTHAVVGDNNDASWIEMWPELGYARVVVATPTKPAGSVTKYVQLVGRASSISSNSTKVEALLEYAGAAMGSGFAEVVIPNATVVELYGALVQPGDLTDAQLSNIIIAFRRSATGASTNARWRDLWVVCTFAEKPTAASTGPASGTSGNVVSSWSHTAGSDGGPQVWYWSRIFTAAQYSAGGFNPETSPYASSSGIEASSTNQHYHPGLAPGTYRHYIKTAQQVYTNQAHWSDWAYSDFTISNPPATTSAEVSIVQGQIYPANGRNYVVAYRDLAEDPWGAGVTVEIERSDDGGATWAPIRFSPIGSGPYDGGGGLEYTATWDWEAPVDVEFRYRARAVKTDGPTIGAWVESIDYEWTVTSGFWLKSAEGVYDNFEHIAATPSMTREDDRTAYHYPLDSAEAIVIAGTRKARTGTLEIITKTKAQADLLTYYANQPAVLIQAPTWWRFPQGWFKFGDLNEKHVRLEADDWRIWPVPIVEVRAPPT
jgi:hypothetical protein